MTKPPSHEDLKTDASAPLVVPQAFEQSRLPQENLIADRYQIFGKLGEGTIETQKLESLQFMLTCMRVVAPVCAIALLALLVLSFYTKSREKPRSFERG